MMIQSNIYIQYYGTSMKHREYCLVSAQFITGLFSTRVSLQTSTSGNNYSIAVSNSRGPKLYILECYQPLDTLQGVLTSRYFKLLCLTVHCDLRKIYVAFLEGIRTTLDESPWFATFRDILRSCSYMKNVRYTIFALICVVTVFYCVTVFYLVYNDCIREYLVTLLHICLPLELTIYVFGEINNQQTCQ